MLIKKLILTLLGSGAAVCVLHSSAQARTTDRVLEIRRLHPQGTAHLSVEPENRAKAPPNCEILPRHMASAHAADEVRFVADRRAGMHDEQIKSVMLDSAPIVVTNLPAALAEQVATRLNNAKKKEPLSWTPDLTVGPGFRELA